MPQTEVGYSLSQVRNIYGDVDRVDYLGGVSFATKEEWRNPDYRYKGVSIESFSNVWTDQIINDRFDIYILQR